MADPIRPLTLSDLWLPGDVLGGAMLREGARVDVATGSGWAEGCIIDTNGGGEPYVVGYFRSSDGYVVDEYQRPDTLRLDFRRLEVRDRATRVLGPDLLPIHAAELRGEITPGEAAGLVWCSVVRREAGLPVVGGWARCLNFTNSRASAGTLLGRSYNWLKDDGDGLFWSRSETVARGLVDNEKDPLPPVEYGWRWGQAYGSELGGAGLDKIHAAILAAGYSLREPGGILLLPLPDGVVGRLDTRQ